MKYALFLILFCLFTSACSSISAIDRQPANSSGSADLVKMQKAVASDYGKAQIICDFYGSDQPASWMVYFRTSDGKSLEGVVYHDARDFDRQGKMSEVISLVYSGPVESQIVESSSASLCTVSLSEPSGALHLVVVHDEEKNSKADKVQPESTIAGHGISNFACHGPKLHDVMTSICVQSMK